MLPSYIPAKGPKPDFPSTGPGIDDAYLNFPKAGLYRSVADTLPNVGDVNVMTLNFYPPFTPLGRNAQWQAVNKALGANMKINVVAFADYPAKFNTVSASGDLPDMMYLQAVPNLPQFLKAQCADLTPYLSGDNIKAYPNLANIPPTPWMNTVYGGGIFGIPIPRPAVGTMMYVNRNRWDKEVGAAVLPKNGADFKKMLLQLTHPERNQWAIASEAGYALGMNWNWWQEMFNGPNTWRLDISGKLIHARETPEYRAAVAYVHDLYGAGVFHPNALTYAAPTAWKSDLIAGKFALNEEPWASYQEYATTRGPQAVPPVQVTTIPQFTFDGKGKAPHFLYKEVIGITVLKKGSPDRIKAMLNILNYMAAPFGSNEGLLMDYGVEGPDFAWNGKGNPIPTRAGIADTYVPWKYVSQHPQPLYDPKVPAYAKQAQADQQLAIPQGVQDPTLGYYSATNGSKGTILTSAFMDAMTSIIVGRSPMTDYDQAVKEWVSKGGDQIRGEYMQAMAAAK
ncbi:MAG: hypothetical protein ACRDHX_13500 [Chloroflexota bacterium]